jgi:hypothetical protein
MDVDIQIYLSNLKQFFKNNPNDLMNLIGDSNQEKFFELVEEQVIENQKNGDGLELTKKQIIDIVLILTKDRDQEKIESFIMKGPFGNIFLN